MHPDLDLQRSIRPGLDILANEIIIAMKKRARFKRNNDVYNPGLVRGQPEQSLLMYELAQVEATHAELGRFTYANQEPFTAVDNIDPIIVRDAPLSPIYQMRSGVGDRILAFYQSWLDVGCEAGSDPNSFGETVTTDVVALLAIMERINLGKYVAESKYMEAPERFAEAGYEREAILGLIVRKDREHTVFELARQLALNYAFDADQAVRLFEFMVEVTKDVEVEYIRKRLDIARA